VPLLKRISFPVMVAFVALLPMCYPQEKPREPPVDHFLGAWALDPEKSHPPNSMETFTVEYREGTYKFVVDQFTDKGPELYYWFLTRMKGDAARVTQMNGKPMSDVEHMVRVDGNTFVNDTKVASEKYSVSKDGQTLKLSRTSKLDPKLPTEHLVFDRIGSSG
jgi:hypothetical protein